MTSEPYPKKNKYWSETIAFPTPSSHTQQKGGRASANGSSCTRNARAHKPAQTGTRRDTDRCSPSESMGECWHRKKIGNCATCRREEHDALSGTNGERQTTPLLEDAAGSKDVRNTGWGAGHQQPSAGLLDRSPSSSPVPMAAVTVRAEEQGTLEKHARNGFGWEGDDRLMRNIVLAEVMLNTTVTHDGREKGIFHDRVQDKVAKIAADRIRDLAKKNAAGTHPLFINLNYDIVRRQWRKILEKSELWNKSRKDRGGDANGRT